MILCYQIIKRRLIQELTKEGEYYYYKSLYMDFKIKYMDKL